MADVDSGITDQHVIDTAATADHDDIHQARLDATADAVEPTRVAP
jgi:hypothetical protein